MVRAMTIGGPRCAVFCCAAAALLAAGCGGSGSARLTAADFASETPSGGSPRNTTVYSIETPPAPASLRLGATDAVRAEPGTPMSVASEPGASAEAGVAAGDVPEGDGPEGDRRDGVVLDAKVGDVNGRPIIASVFLEDLMPRLRAAMQTAPDRTAWRREALQIIAEKLSLTIRDEVLYREAQSMLPEQVQQVGLRHFLSRTREQIRLQNSGSVSRADELVREQYGKSLDEFLQDQQRQAVIAQMMDGREDYAPVTWSDIRNEYARRFDEFNPPPTVFARMILPRNEEQAEAAAARLESGEAFASVASDRSVNLYRPAEGGLIADEGTLVEGELSEMDLVGFPALNEALVGLEPGAWAGPVTYRSGRLGFVSIDRIERPESRSLMDVQLELRAEIEFRRKREARERFYRQLIEDAGFGQERQMEISFALLRIAETRLMASGG